MKKLSEAVLYQLTLRNFSDEGTLDAAAQRLALGEVAPCGGGLHVLLTVGGRTPAQELVPRAEQAGVKLTRLCDHGVMRMGAQAERVVLLGFSGMDEAQIEKGLEALKRAWF